MSASDQSSVSDQDVCVPRISVPHIGQLLGGRYLVTCRLAEGTFGHTYLAKDTHLPNSPECVVKQLKPQTNARAMEMARRLFGTEARTLYQLGSHDQIPQLYAHFEQNNEFFLAQEFIDGYSVSDELTPDRPWLDTQIAQLLQEILEVLAFVHSQQVIHRDIKPGNLIRRKHDGKIVLIDFGAVKQATQQFLVSNTGATDYTVAIGTFGYIPKEQLGGRPRFSSDVYAVGMIGIQALTGLHPNDLREDERTGELRWRDNLLAPVHPQFADIIDCMVRYDFRDRYSDAETALKAIHALPKDFLELIQIPPWRTASGVEFNLPPTATFSSQVIEKKGIPSGKNLSQPSDLHPQLLAQQKAFQSATSTQTEFVQNSQQFQDGENQGQSPLASYSNLPQLTQMTDVVAPSFSRIQSESEVFMSTFSKPSPLKSKQLSSGYHRQDFRNSETPIGFSHRKEEMLAVIEWVHHWIARSWHLIALIGGMSLTLMLARGMLATTRTQPVTRLDSNAIQETLQGAQRLRSFMESDTLTFSIGDTSSNRIVDYEDERSKEAEAEQFLVNADHARVSGRYQDALRLYQQALGIKPNLVDAIWGQCATFNAQDQFESASEKCYDALAIAPNHAKSLWSSAEANTGIGNIEKATEERNRALQLDPTLPQSLSNPERNISSTSEKSE